MQSGKVLGILIVTVVLTTAVTPAGGAIQSDLAAPGDVDPDSVHIGVDVRPDGSAEWTIQYRVALNDENETAAYEDIVADVENNSSAYVDRFASRINATVDEAESETGRSMSASNFSVTAKISGLTQSYGTTTYTFVWHGFAATEGETLRVGDALRGFFLDTSTTMRVTWLDDYTATTVLPSPSDQQATWVVWQGPIEFGEDEPQIVLEPDASEPGDAETTGSSAGPTTAVTDGSNDALLLVALVIGTLLALSFIVAWYYRTREERGGPAGSTTVGGPDSATPEETSVPPPQPVEESAPPEELLSNEERVIRFLADHGGRAKQQELVDGLDWTEAKTSQVLSSMAEEGTVEKFRIGRENVVKLPEDDTDEI
ncbi:helix-turn-helix transcriptional regulator [Halanaeroarchaeum sulfurireducens]|uniref:HTH iclR-type domain-containing protein n=1 Tax=Halanaeroarchaeum sulfurireducens TaxID=1604004 RepID=A0A0N9N4N2_9EURY|nr:hypothetical protein [Halanaeroarchaeum sulfurireducens]ALG82082.1 hypothetical protein HLASA_1188 [Halanaeroarchaeum sulfurireducens]